MRIKSNGNLKKRKYHTAAVFALFRLAALLTAAALAAIILFLIIKGAGSISWDFLSQAPAASMTKGGIFPAIIGTFYLTAGAMLAALPLGLATAIYLSEYARPGRINYVIRLSVVNLAGVPSVIFGLFGLAFFVSKLGLGISILSGSLTLALIIMPTIISASEEALKQIPLSYREASYALGASHWQTVFKVVLPAAAPGIITGSVLSLARAAGETAPIMYTAAVFYTLHLPSSPFDPVMALPYHIYKLATAGTHEALIPMRYGACLVLVCLVLGMSLAAIIIRTKIRRNKQW
jgi:phosphate transport system permease protein